MVENGVGEWRVGGRACERERERELVERW